MDDLLLFTPSKGSHMAKLEDLPKALLKNGLKYHQRNHDKLLLAFILKPLHQVLEKC